MNWGASVGDGVKTLPFSDYKPSDSVWDDSVPFHGVCVGLLFWPFLALGTGCEGLGTNHHPRDGNAEISWQNGKLDTPLDGIVWTRMAGSCQPKQIQAPSRKVLRCVWTEELCSPRGGYHMVVEFGHSRCWLVLFLVLKLLIGSCRILWVVLICRTPVF